MLFCKRCVLPGSDFVHNHDLNTQIRYTKQPLLLRHAAAAPIQGSGPNICKGVATCKKFLTYFNSAVDEVTALAAPGVPFSLSAMPALEAVAGVEELSLPDILLQQVCCSWNHSTACIVVLLENCSSPQHVCQPTPSLSGMSKIRVCCICRAGACVQACQMSLNTLWSATVCR